MSVSETVAREHRCRGGALPVVDREMAAQAAERAPPKREEHCRPHEPYRAWCHACIAGRGRADPHAMSNESERLAGDRGRLGVLVEPISGDRW